jgi:MFS family permease
MSSEDSTISYEKATYSKLLSQPRFIFAALSSGLSYLGFGMIEPILAERLTDFKLSQVQIGLFFAIACTNYTLGCLVAACLPKRIEKRAILMTASLMTSIAFLFAGPSTVLNFADSLTLMIIGNVLFGFFLPFMFIAALPEMTDFALAQYDASQKQRVNNLSSGAMTGFLGLGQTLGPIFGTCFSVLLNFRWTTDIFAMICLVFGIVYFLLADGVGAFKKSCSP